MRAGGNRTGGDRPPGTDVDTCDSLIPVPHADLSPALKARDSKGPSSDGDGDGAILVPMVAHSLRAEGFDASEDGTGRGTPLVPVAFHNRQDPDVSGDVTHPIGAKDNGMGIWHGMQVRRLTPIECERLQGFPDQYTNVPYRGKPAADRPRYKALGNSMAVPVMRWIGERVQVVEDVYAELQEAA